MKAAQSSMLNDCERKARKGFTSIQKNIVYVITFPPNSAHTYSIEVKDTLGNTVTDHGNFKTTIVKIGLNFGADEPTELDPPGSALLAADVAGVPAVAQANWNNLSGLGGGYRVLDSAGAVLKDYVLADCDANPTAYKEVPQNLAAGVHGVGNYIVFKGLKAAAITLEATTVAPQGSGTPPRAPVNAVQLVPTASSAPPPSLSLAIQLSGGQIKITWTGTGAVLQQSTDLKTWTHVAAAASPYTPTPGPGAHFYRLKQ